MRIGYRALLLFVGTLAVADAASVHEITVSRQDGSIVSAADFVIDVPRADVIAAFSAFSELSRLNPAIIESRSQRDVGGRDKVTTRLRDCVAMFCRTLTLVELVTVAADGTIRAEVAPEGGDFTSGSTVWTFEADGERTHVSYRSKVKPDFWLPPVVGQRAMRSALARQIAASVANLEQRYRDWGGYRGADLASSTTALSNAH